MPTTPKPGPPAIDVQPPAETAPAPAAATPVISEGVRQELLIHGQAGDPLTGRTIVLDDAGQPKFKD